jgi:uncharacterized metal-binding protein YceD (DUF177 family)
MLVFDLRSLSSAAATVDGVLESGDPVWQEQDTVPVAGVRVTGRLSQAGPARYYFSGRLAGTVHGECRRCLTDVEAPTISKILMCSCSTRGRMASI